VGVVVGVAGDSEGGQVTNRPRLENTQKGSTKGPRELATLRAAGNRSPYGGVLMRKHEGVGGPSAGGIGLWLGLMSVCGVCP
jgi:hypothetical protein